MIDISIKTAGDVVYWLSSSGFKKGMIKNTLLRSDTNMHKKYELTYYCTCSDYDSLYQGDCPDIIFDTKEEMLEYYSKTIKKL